MESTRADTTIGQQRPPLRDGCGNLIDLHPIEILLERITSKWHLAQIWLFGSRARGDARPSSDWDLFVVLPDEAPDGDFDPQVGWQLQRASGVSADVIACRATDFREDRATPNTLAFDVGREGLLVRER